MKLRELMTRTVETIDPHASAREAAIKMKAAGVGMLPVVESGQPQGVLTDRDLVIRGMAENAEAKCVSELMTRLPVCMHEDSDAEVAAEMMRARQIGRLLVTDSKGRLVGVISHDDLAVAMSGDRRIGRLAEGLGAAHRKPGPLVK